MIWRSYATTCPHWHRLNARFSVVLVVATLVAAGCGETRPTQSQAQLLSIRAASDARRDVATKGVVTQLVHRAKGQYDEYKAGRRPTPPVIDVLIVSGGGDWGAFGAGFLKGWERVPKSDPLAKPEFAAVTGVSTGALIAPFAFLADNASTDIVVHLYRNPQPDWVKTRGWLYFLPSNVSLAEVPGLERELRTAVNAETVKRIEEAGADGRVLAVSTTNIDDASPRAFDMVAEARRARQTGNLDRFRDILLASAGIPGAFPFRMIDNQMYVDGGVIGSILYGGRAAQDDTLAPEWRETYPELPIPKMRYWVIFNNQFRPPPQVTEPSWLSIITRSMETASRSSSLTAMRHLAAMAEIARLKWHADVEVRIVSIPGAWMPPKPGSFQKETMNELVDLGEQMGADPKTWTDAVP